MIHELYIIIVVLQGTYKVPGICFVVLDESWLYSNPL